MRHDKRVTPRDRRRLPCVVAPSKAFTWSGSRTGAKGIFFRVASSCWLANGGGVPDAVDVPKEKINNYMAKVLKAAFLHNFKVKNAIKDNLFFDSYHGS